MTNLTEEVHQHSEKVQAGLEEDDSSDSPRRVWVHLLSLSLSLIFLRVESQVVSKQPSLEEDAPASNETPLSRAPRKKTLKKVAYDSDLTRSCGKTKRAKLDSEAHTSALKRAKELQSNLSTEHPSFIKQIQRSHITGIFKLGVPADFCRLHLHTHKEDVILEDESGGSYLVKFSLTSEGNFYGGWRQFSAEQNLLEGDVIVFHMTKPCYFKVFIVRGNDQTVVERANLSNSGTNEGTNNQTKVGTNEGKKKKIKRETSHKKDPSPAAPNVVEECGRSGPQLSNSDPGPESTQSVRDDLRSSDMEAAPLSGRDADFDKFKIIVNGETVDLSESTRFKYYKLCCSRESFLHEHLLKNIDRTLAAGIINGTLNVADDIRACKIGSTSEEDFAMWDNTLEGFKRLGMDVDFLRDRLKRLASLGSELREKEEVKRYVEAGNKRNRLKEDVKSVEAKLLELRRAKEMAEDEMKNMKLNTLKHTDAFRQEATAPW